MDEQLASLLNNFLKREGQFIWLLYLIWLYVVYKPWLVGVYSEFTTRDRARSEEVCGYIARAK